jgi:hypothetical protein
VSSHNRHQTMSSQQPALHQAEWYRLVVCCLHEGVVWYGYTASNTNVINHCLQKSAPLPNIPNGGHRAACVQAGAHNIPGAGESRSTSAGTYKQPSCCAIASS